MSQDYLGLLRANMQRAADLKAAERAAEAKAQRGAKLGLISFLVVVFTLVAIFGQHLN